VDADEAAGRKCLHFRVSYHIMCKYSSIILHFLDILYNIISYWLCSDDDMLNENDLMESEFTEDEVKKVIFGSYSDGAPGPDALLFSFLSKVLGCS
jgi:hypothetical protein